MLMLCMDTSGGACSAAICEDERVICEQYLHDRLTHSQTLMGLVDGCFSEANRDISQIDVFAVTVGPGSFTGLRIGVCTAKGFAQVTGKPVAAIDTLELLSQNIVGFDGVVCPILDARRGQVYAALFEQGVRLCENFAAPIEEAVQKLVGRRALFLGDGVDALQERIVTLRPDAQFAPKQNNYQRAGMAARLVLRQQGQFKDAKTIVPAYLRESQAERLKKERACKAR